MWIVFFRMFDVSLLLCVMEEYVVWVIDGICLCWFEGYVVIFGYFGDGNIYFVIGVGE